MLSSLKAAVGVWALALASVLLSACHPASGVAASSPVVAERRAVGAFDTSISYDDQGTGDTAIVFVHGWACDRSYWREQVAVFARDYRVITVDLGGHGASGTNRSDWSMGSFGRDVAAVVEQIDAENVVLVGHSMGGPVVLEAARLIPGRVIGIVGVDTLKDLSRTPGTRQQMEKAWAKQKEDFSSQTRTFVRKGFFTDAAPKDLVDWIAEDMASAHPKIAVEAGIELGMYDAKQAIAALSEIPIALIQADYRPTNPATLLEIHPNAREIIIPRASHFLMMERPRAFNQALFDVLDGF